MEKELLKRIEEIEKRNKKVEGDKAWETSWLRKIIIMIATYFFAFLYLKIADKLLQTFSLINFRNKIKQLFFLFSQL